MSKVIALLATVAALVLSACGDPVEQPADPTNRPPTSADPLTGRTFVGTAIDVDGEPVDAPEGVTMEIAFEATEDQGQRIAAVAGCNHLGAQYRLSGDRLVVGEISTTEMGCDPDRHAFDELLAALLSSPEFSLQDDQLTLTVTDAARELRAVLTDTDVADPAPPLEGTVWTLQSIIDAETASSVPAEAQPVTMTLQDGFLSIDTNCNGVGADYARSGDTLELTPGFSTKMFCGDEINQLEMELAAILDGEVSIEQDRQRLTIRSGDGRGLDFTAEP
jgi:heat shock protein HslJ